MIRSSRSWQAVAVAAVAGLVLTACGTTDDGGETGSSSNGGGEDQPGDRRDCDGLPGPG